jgi:hypothetical protein
MSEHSFLIVFSDFLTELNFGEWEFVAVVIVRPVNKEQPGISAPRYSLATPAIRDIQSSYWSRWYTRH